MGKILSFHRPFNRYTSVGCYPLVYVIDTKWNGMMTFCAKCASKERDEDNATASADRTIASITPDIHWEGPAVVCENCNEEIPSAYGDPDDEEIHGEVPASYLSNERE